MPVPRGAIDTRDTTIQSDRAARLMEMVIRVGVGADRPRAGIAGEDENRPREARRRVKEGKLLGSEVALRLELVLLGPALGQAVVCCPANDEGVVFSDLILGDFTP